ncbi:peptidase [Caballeronia sp. LZ035]|uniref:peptidase n=1 Tax=Caballeronia sp. LZ035 TaxID=3038568 RepID=UPI0028578D71|nr:peptidase [Caballeronia sp. LZ035]MDR5759523.1 peptidase [Caballeronia sp. LZ035]
MTYCVAISVDDGLVFLSDTRVSAGVEEVAEARKMTVFETPGERVLVLLGAGSLAQTQAVVDLLKDACDGGSASLLTAPTLRAAAGMVADAVRAVHRREASALEAFELDFNCSFILGGQIRTHAATPPARPLAEREPVAPPEPQLFLIYPSGNTVCASAAMPYLQIGESRHGRPLLDWAFTRRALSLDEAAKCALLSMDATLRANLSVAYPLDLLAYERDTFRVDRFTSLDQHHDYPRNLRRAWCERVDAALEGMPALIWGEPEGVPRARKGRRAG